MTIAPLAPCPSCSRHVRINVSECPFCAAAVAIAPESVVPAATSALSRAAAFTFATTLALGCASNPPPPAPEPLVAIEPAPPAAPLERPPHTPPPPHDYGNAVPAYGVPVPIPEPVPVPEVVDAGVDVPAADVHAPPPARDAGHHAAPAHPTPPRRTVSVGVRYGSPPRIED